MPDPAEAPASQHEPGPDQHAARPSAELAALIASRIRDVPDYPQPGVVFKDITPLLADARAFAAVVQALAATYGPVDKVACCLGAGFVPIRKKGKLPGVTLAEDYQLEYGTATIEVLTDAFAPGERVLVIDDVLATGGTARATADLVQRAGAQVAGISVLLELSFLNGRAKLPDLPVSALLTV
jgi:adenine phosphoribosyltransferase